MKEIKEAYAKQSLPNSELKKQAEQRIQDFLVENIATPRYMTIQDLFSDRDRMGVMAEFAPEVDRGLNAIFGTKIFDPATKSIVDLGESMPRKKEAIMQAEREKAVDLQKSQRDYANSVYKQIGDLELADKKLAQDADQFAQNIAFERERLAEERRNNIAMEDIARSKSKNENEIITADKKKLSENNETLAAIEDGIQLIKKNPNAYSYIKGKLGPDIANRIDPKGVYTRTQIDNITAVYRKWLTGAQMSDRERKDYERFLPAPTDNGQIILEKLKGMENAIKTKNNAILKQYGVQSKKDSLGIL